MRRSFTALLRDPGSDDPWIRAVTWRGVKFPWVNFPWVLPQWTICKTCSFLPCDAGAGWPSLQPKLRARVSRMVKSPTRSLLLQKEGNYQRPSSRRPGTVRFGSVAPHIYIIYIYIVTQVDGPWRFLSDAPEYRPGINGRRGKVVSPVPVPASLLDSRVGSRGT